MAKFSRLQWIPMIVKAYNDAKERSATGQSTFASTLSNVDSGDSPDKPMVPNQRTLPPRTASQRKPIGTPPARQTPSKRTPPKLSLPKSSIPTRQYARMLKELRETQVKLSKLESIHHRLSEMQTNIEQQLSAIMERVNTQPSMDETANQDDRPFDRRS